MMSPRLPRTIFLFALLGWACSESDPGASEDVGSGGSAMGGSSSASGGRRASGGETSESGGDAGDGSGGSGGRRGSGGETSASGGDVGEGSGGRGSGGRRGSGGDSAGSGGELSGSGGRSSVACGEKPERSRGYRKIEVDGASRDYYLVPAKTKGEPVPLVLGFHAWGGKGEWDVGTFSLDYASEGNAVLMYPDGLEQAWAGGIGWDTRGNDNADLRLVQRLIEEAKADHCIDESKIFAVGFSWGGWMATQTACVFGDQIRAFISIAGGGPMNATCQGAVSGMIVHGTNDQSENISSGRSTLTRFREENGCGTGTSSVYDGACQAYSGCEKETLWCEHPGEHIIPEFIYRVGWQFLTNAR